jgi:hypothetical protein
MVWDIDIKTRHCDIRRHSVTVPPVVLDGKKKRVAQSDKIWRYRPVISFHALAGGSYGPDNRASHLLSVVVHRMEIERKEGAEADEECELYRDARRTFRVEE